MSRDASPEKDFISTGVQTMHPQIAKASSIKLGPKSYHYKMLVLNVYREPLSNGDYNELTKVLCTTRIPGREYHSNTGDYDSDNFTRSSETIVREVKNMSRPVRRPPSAPAAGPSHSAPPRAPAAHDPTPTDNLTADPTPAANPTAGQPPAGRAGTATTSTAGVQTSSDDGDGIEYIRTVFNLADSDDECSNAPAPGSSVSVSGARATMRSASHIARQTTVDEYFARTPQPAERDDPLPGLTPALREYVVRSRAGVEELNNNFNLFMAEYQEFELIKLATHNNFEDLRMRCIRDNFLNPAEAHASSSSAQQPIDNLSPNLANPDAPSTSSADGLGTAPLAIPGSPSVDIPGAGSFVTRRSTSPALNADGTLVDGMSEKRAGKRRATSTSGPSPKRIRNII